MNRILIQDAGVLTMDDSLGDIPAADVLIEDDRIAAIEQVGLLRVPDAEIVDARGMLMIPGLVNAHMHTWQTSLRGIASNWTLFEYFKKVHAGVAAMFTPEDVRIATFMGALNQLNCGTTTLVDWCHNNPTPEHNDAAMDALFESGIRAMFFHGTPKPDPGPGGPGFWEVPHPRAELERLISHRAGGLIGIGAAILGPHYSTLDVSLHDFRMARELGVIASMHQGGGTARAPEGWRKLEEEKLLGPRVNIVHGNSLTDDQLSLFCTLGMSFTVTPEVEMSMGHGFPITGRLRKFGRAPSLGVDLESLGSGDMLTVARTALVVQRASEAGTTTREALSWATIEGARMLGMEDRIGSIRPGKQADLVLIDAGALNMQPVHDPVSTVVMQASLANIDSVMVAGQWKKQQGKLLVDGMSAKLRQLQRSGQRIEMQLTAQAAAHS